MQEQVLCFCDNCFLIRFVYHSCFQESDNRTKNSFPIRFHNHAKEKVFRQNDCLTPLMIYHHLLNGQCLVRYGLRHIIATYISQAGMWQITWVPVTGEVRHSRASQSESLLGLEATSAPENTTEGE